MIKGLLFIFAATVLFSAHHAAADDKCVCRDCKKFTQFCGVHEVSRSQCENMAKGTCTEMAQDQAEPPTVPKAARHKTVKAARTAVHMTKGSLRGHAPHGDPWEHVSLLPFRRDSPMGTYPEYKYQGRPNVEQMLAGDPCAASCDSCEAAYPPFKDYVDLTDKLVTNKVRVCLCNPAFLAATVPGQQFTPFPSDGHLPYEFYMAGAVENDAATKAVAVKFFFRSMNFIARVSTEVASSRVCTEAPPKIAAVCTEGKTGVEGLFGPGSFSRTRAYQKGRGPKIEIINSLYNALVTFFSLDSSKLATEAEFALIPEVMALGIRDIHTILWNTVYQATGRRGLMIPGLESIARKLSSGEKLSAGENVAGPWDKKIMQEKEKFDDEWCQRRYQTNAPCDGDKHDYSFKHNDENIMASVDSWVEYRFMDPTKDGKETLKGGSAVTEDTYTAMGMPLSASEKTNLAEQRRPVNVRRGNDKYADADCPAKGDLTDKTLQRRTQSCEGGFVRVASQIGGRIIGGPSGTTLAYLGLGRYFDFSPREMYLLRNSMLPFMIAVEDHSLIEILVSGAILGVPFPPGSAMYSAEGLFSNGAENTPECKALKKALTKVHGGRAATTPREMCSLPASAPAVKKEEDDVKKRPSLRTATEDPSIDNYEKNADIAAIEAEPEPEVAPPKATATVADGKCDYDALRVFKGKRFCTSQAGDAYELAKGSGVPTAAKNHCFNKVVDLYTGSGCYPTIAIASKLCYKNGGGFPNCALNNDVEIDLSKVVQPKCGATTFSTAEGWPAYIKCFYNALDALPQYKAVERLPIGDDATRGLMGALAEKYGGRKDIFGPYKKHPRVYRVGGVVSSSKKVGDEQTLDYKFLSTSFGQDFFKCNAKIEGNKSSKRNLLFLKPKGSKCKVLDKDVTKFAHEKEVLCQPGSKWRVLDIQEDTIPDSDHHGRANCKKVVKTTVLEEL